jgi:hypothetical protein
MLTIRVDRAKYIVYIPGMSTNGVTPDPIEYMAFMDVSSGLFVTDLIANVTNQTGTSYSTLVLLQDYLNTFFQRSEGQVIYKEGASTDNQLIQIAELEALKAELETIRENTEHLHNIREGQEKSNKILNKIYNPQ